MPERVQDIEERFIKHPEVSALISQFEDIHLIRFLDGEYILEKGKEDDDAYLLVHGSCVVEEPVEGQKTGSPLAVFMCDPLKPMFVGEMAYWGHTARSASVRSSGCTHAFRLHPHHIKQILSNYPKLTHILLEQFANRLVLCNESLLELRKAMKMETDLNFVDANTVLFEKGQPAGPVYQLVDGSVEKISPEGSETLNGGKEEELFLGLESFLKNCPRQYTITTKTNCVLVKISREHILAFIRNFPEVILNFILREEK